MRRDVVFFFNKTRYIIKNIKINESFENQFILIFNSMHQQNHFHLYKTVDNK